MAENNPQTIHQPVLKVLGLGGGGSNAVNRMIELGLTGVDFIVANTDLQALETSHARTKIALGPQLTRGLGAGGSPEIGHKAALESREEIKAALEGADMVFLTAGMGGGTGTGAIAVAGEIAKAIGAVTIAIVTMPFSFEMGKRQHNATEGLKLLRPNTDTLIAIPNDRLLQIAPEHLPLETAFRLADDVLRQAVQGIAELVTEPGLINVDFSHIRNMMKLGGGALMSIGHGKGVKKAMDAIKQALNHPLLDSIDIHDSAGIIANFSGGNDLTLYDVGEALHSIKKETGDAVDIVLGFSNDERMSDRAQVILVVTGLGAPSLEEVLPGAERISLSSPAERRSPIPQRRQAPQPEQVDIPLAATPAMANAVSDLDLPAFMRRRDRYQDADPQRN